MGKSKMPGGNEDETYSETVISAKTGIQTITVFPNKAVRWYKGVGEWKTDNFPKLRPSLSYQTDNEYALNYAA